MNDKDTYDGFGMEVKRLSTLECLLKRPGMLFGEPNLEKVLIMLDGYFYGLQAIKMKNPDSEHYAELSAEFDALYNWAESLLKPEQKRMWKSLVYMLEGLEAVFSSHDDFCRAGLDMIIARRQKS